MIHDSRSPTVSTLFRDRVPTVRPWIGCLALLLAVALAYSPASAREPSHGCTEGSTLVVVVRHAEKRAGDDPDPGLSTRGEQRARQLTKLLSGAGIEAVYTTQYLRTRATGEPLADELGLEINVREITPANSDDHAQRLADEVLERHCGGAVLVVGHSNTVASLVRAFSGKSTAGLDEGDYDRIFTISSTRPGQGRVVEARYPAPD